MSNDNPALYAPTTQPKNQKIPARQDDVGASAAGDLAREYNLNQRMERLVKGVLEGRVVPFLGAGISMYAPAPPSFKESAPTLKAVKIAENLASALREAIKSEDNCNLPTKHLINRALETAGHNEDGMRLLNWLELDKHDLGKRLRSALEKPTPTSNDDHDTSERTTQGSYPSSILIPVDRGAPAVWPTTLQLGEVAELCWAILGPTKTCEVLRLQDWHVYLPMAAHHYLAMLVREGLVTEILETNYDNFVEEAVLETFGSERRNHEVGPSSKARVDAAPVIHDLDSYRKHIAQPRRSSRNEALVKVVKLNGCATAYSDNFSQNSDKSARKIILTEEQLQSWGEKAWAQDLLRDRVRSRALLFIGFGNQDPIVRHHAVAVIREFSPTELPQDGHWFKMENAPFVMAFERNLTFFQFQILRAFRDAHKTRLTAEVPSHTEFDQVATVYMNAFLGCDGPVLDNGRKTEDLPADVFLRRVVGLSICRHVSDVYFDSKSAVASYLLGTLRQPDVLLEHVKRTLLTGDVTVPPPFEAWLRLENESTSEQSSSAWSEVCFSIRGDNAGRAGYRPFAEATVKQPMLLVLMALLGMSTDTSPLEAADLRQRCRRELDGASVAGFRLLDTDPEQGQCPLYATSYYDAFVGDDAEPRQAASSSATRDATNEVVRARVVPSNAVVLLLGRGTQGAFRRYRWIAAGTDGDEKSLCELIAIGDLAALRGDAVGTVSLAQARQNIERLRQEPEALLGSEENWQRYCTEE